MRFIGETEVRAIDRKVFSACRQYCNEYTYLWFSSDRTIINIDVLYKSLDKYFKRGFDLIVFDRYDYMGISPKEYSDCTELFHDCCWRMTSLSSCIVSGGLLRKCVQKFPVISANSSSLWLPIVYFHVIAEEAFKAVYFSEGNSWKPNSNMGEAFWALSGNMLWQWGEKWCQTIESLPALYDEEKDYVIRSHDKFTGVFSIVNLLRMKAYGNISLRKVREFQSYASRVTETNIFWFYIIAIAINRGFIVLVRKIFKYFKRINQKVKCER